MTIFLLGANDYMTLHKDNVTMVVEQQIDDIEKVISGGVNNLLVMGIPNLSLTPFGKHSDEKRKLKDESIAHNALLKNSVEELKENIPSIKYAISRLPMHLR